MTDAKDNSMYRILFIACVIFLSNTVNAEYLPSGVCKSETILGTVENGKYESLKFDISSKFTERYMLGIISMNTSIDNLAGDPSSIEVTFFVDRLLSEGVIAINNKYRMLPEAELISLIKGVEENSKKKQSILSLSNIEQLTSAFPGIRKTYELGTTACGDALCRAVTLGGGYIDGNESANYSGKVLVDPNRNNKTQETPWSQITLGEVIELTFSANGFDRNKKPIKFNFSLSLPSCVARKFEDSEFIFDVTKMKEMTKAEFDAYALAQNPNQKSK